MLLVRPWRPGFDNCMPAPRTPPVQPCALAVVHTSMWSDPNKVGSTSKVSPGWCLRGMSWRLVKVRGLIDWVPKQKSRRTHILLINLQFFSS